MVKGKKASVTPAFSKSEVLPSSQVPFYEMENIFGMRFFPFFPLPFWSNATKLLLNFCPPSVLYLAQISQSFLDLVFISLFLTTQRPVWTWKWVFFFKRMSNINSTEEENVLEFPAQGKAEWHTSSLQILLPRRQAFPLNGWLQISRYCFYNIIWAIQGFCCCCFSWMSYSLVQWSAKYRPP